MIRRSDTPWADHIRLGTHHVRCVYCHCRPAIDVIAHGVVNLHEPGPVEAALCGDCIATFEAGPSVTLT